MYSVFMLAKICGNNSKTHQRRQADSDSILSDCADGVVRPEKSEL